MLGMFFLAFVYGRKVFLFLKIINSAIPESIFFQFLFLIIAPQYIFLQYVWCPRYLPSTHAFRVKCSYWDKFNKFHFLIFHFIIFKLKCDFEIKDVNHWTLLGWNWIQTTGLLCDKEMRGLFMLTKKHCNACGKPGSSKTKIEFRIIKKNISSIWRTKCLEPCIVAMYF